MSDDLSAVEKLGELNTTFWDLFVRTQSGQIRRVSLPFSHFLVASYHFGRENSAGDDAGVDKIICGEADRRGCTYAEALINFLDVAFDEGDTESYAQLAVASVENGQYERVHLPAFRRRQQTLEELWRQAHGEKRAVLPTCFD